MSDEQLLREYVEAEIDDNKKGARYGTIMFVILCLVMAGYFAWLRAMLEEAVEPRALARVAVQVIDDQIPVATRSLADNIREALPRIAAYTVNTVVDNSIPEMSKHATGFLTEHSRALSEFAAFTGHEIFVRVLREKRDEIKRSNPTQGMPLTAAQLVMALEAGLPITLERELTMKMSEEVAKDSDRESAAVKLHKSAQSLRNINARLNVLAEGGMGTRQDQVSKKIIGAWWSWLRNSQTANASDHPEDDEEISEGDAASKFHWKEKVESVDNSDDFEVLKSPDQD
jgi:hypothetical protein